MSPAASLLQQALRALVLRIVLLLDGFLGARAAWLRARIAALPEYHKRRVAFEAELARAERARALIADPGSYDDPSFRGLLAEVARVRNDAGRRAMARRILYCFPFFPLPAAWPAPCAELALPEGRCTSAIAAG